MGSALEKQTGRNVESAIDVDDEEFTCQICIEPMTSRNKKFNNNNQCVHPFCSDCIIKYIESKLEDNICNIECPALNCNNLFHPLACRPKIPGRLFDKWSDLLCKKLVLEFHGVYCPNVSCSELVLNECQGNVRRTLCPKCKKPFCFRCKVPWHAGYSCKRSRGLRDPNDIAFNDLMKSEGWRRCPECGYCIERIDGCNNMTCRCGTTFNYDSESDMNIRWGIWDALIRVFVLLVINITFFRSLLYD